MNSFDVLIAGGGPVGLLYASELSNEYRVVVLDGGKVPTYRKSWAVYKWALEKSGYEEFASNAMNKLGLHSHETDQSVVVELNPDQTWVTIDEYRLMEHLINTIISNGGEIHDHTPVCDVVAYNDYIEVQTNDITYRSRLMLDCTGVNSPFIPKGDNLLIQYYWNIYGQMFTGGDVDFSVSHILVHIGDIDGYKILINDVPEGNQCYTPWLYIMADHKVPLDKLRDYYHWALETDFLKDKVKSYQSSHEKYGWAPVRDFKQHATDRILSLGDAGGLGPWASGATVGFTFETLPAFLPRIKDCLNTNKLTATDLEQVLSLPSDYLVMLDIGKLFFVFIMNTSGEQFAKLVSAIGEISDNKDIELNMVFNDAKEFLKLLGILAKYFKLREIIDILTVKGWRDMQVIFRQMFKHLVFKRF